MEQKSSPQPSQVQSIPDAWWPCTWISHSLMQPCCVKQAQIALGNLCGPPERTTGMASPISGHLNLLCIRPQEWSSKSRLKFQGMGYGGKLGCGRREERGICGWYVKWIENFLIKKEKKKWYHHSDKEAVHSMGKDFCQLHCWQRINIPNI